jgi:hypothetical protein
MFAFLGRKLAEKLRCSSIIASNYTMDINKNSKSDYSIQIGKWKPKLLIEIHGHGDRNADKNKIEISSGERDEKYAVWLAGVLNDCFGKNVGLVFEGRYEKIYFKATDAVNINDGRWTSFHIELPKRVRLIPDSKSKPPEVGYQLIDQLSEIFLKKFPKKFPNLHI